MYLNTYKIIHFSFCYFFNFVIWKHEIEKFGNFFKASQKCIRVIRNT